jgi:hypothetical protein
MLTANVAMDNRRTSSANSAATHRVDARNTSHHSRCSRSSLLPQAIALHLSAVLQPLCLSHPTPCRRCPNHLVATAIAINVAAQSCGGWDVWSCIGSGKLGGVAVGRADC